MPGRLCIAGLFGFEPFGKLASESAPPLKSEADKNTAVISAFIHKIIAEKHSGSEELLLSYANGEQALVQDPG